MELILVTNQKLHSKQQLKPLKVKPLMEMLKKLHQQK